MLTVLMMVLSVLVPPAVLVGVARQTMNVTTAFMPADRADRLRRITSVAAYAVSIGYMVVWSIAVATMDASQDAALSVPPPYLLWPAVVLRTMMLALTWCFALIAGGMSSVMAMNYMRVASGRRLGIALILAAFGSVCLALGQTVAMQGTSMPINIVHIVGVGLHAAAWALRRPGT